MNDETWILQQRIQIATVEGRGPQAFEGARGREDEQSEACADESEYADDTC
jgi:hypothetical protein